MSKVQPKKTFTKVGISVGGALFIVGMFYMFTYPKYDVEETEETTEIAVKEKVPV